MSTTEALQQCLLDVRGDRDVAKASLERLQRSADFYRRSIYTLASRNGIAGKERQQQLQDLVGALGSEASGNGPMIREPAASPTKAHDVLRQSLDDAEKRCEKLESDMTQQNDANQQLEETVDALKQGNKRYYDQIRLQTEEQNRLLQQRTELERRIEQLTKSHQANKQAVEEETQAKAAANSEKARDRLSCARVQCSAKQNIVQSRLKATQNAAARLKDEQVGIRLEVCSLKETIHDALLRSQADILARFGAALERQGAKLRDKQMVLDTMDKELQLEQQGRQLEALASGQRHCELMTNKEDLQYRSTREVSELTAQLQALERMVVTERAAWDEENQRLLLLKEETAKERGQKSADLDMTDCKVAQLEAAVKKVASDSADKEKVEEELRERLRAIHDSLQSALLANEHLRIQMDEQRNRMQEKNEIDLEEAQANYDAKLKDAEQRHESEAGLQRKYLKDLEEQTKYQEEVLKAVSLQLDQLNEECVMMAQESASLQGRVDAERQTCSSTEREFFDLKRTAAVKRISVETSIDRWRAETESIEQEISCVKEKQEEYQRSSALREAEDATKLTAAEAALREASDYLATCARKLAEAEQSRSRCEAEVAASRQRGLTVHTSLQETLDMKRKSSDAEKKRLNEILSTERAIAWQAKSQLDEERQTSKNMMELAAEESRTKLDLVQREKIRTEQAYKMDITAAHEDVQRQQKRAEALESDLHRISSLAAESEADFDWIRQELGREDKESGLTIHLISDDMRVVLTDIERSHAEEQRLTQQLEAACFRNEQERVQLIAEAEQIWPDGKTVSEVVKLGRNGDGMTMDSTMMLTPERNLHNSSMSSAFPQPTQMQLEGHIQRLQRQTDELRQTHHNQVFAGKVDGASHAMAP